MSILEIYFATSNEHKFKEAKEILAKLSPTIKLKRFDFKHNEIRSDNLEEIALEAVNAAYEACGKKPVFVEDTGLFINELNGFPGTYSAWAYKKLGNAGMLALLMEKNDRSAAFRTCIAFRTNSGTRIFVGECGGSIAESERGKGGFGYDPLFVPNGEKTTFSENAALKNEYSHRYKSLLLLANHIAAMKHNV